MPWIIHFKTKYPYNYDGNSNNQLSNHNEIIHFIFLVNFPDQADTNISISFIKQFI